MRVRVSCEVCVCVCACVGVWVVQRNCGQSVRDVSASVGQGTVWRKARIKLNHRPPCREGPPCSKGGEVGYVFVLSKHTEGTRPVRCSPRQPPGAHDAHRHRATFLDTQATKRPGGGRGRERSAPHSAPERAVALSAKRPLRWSRATGNQQPTQAGPCLLDYTSCPFHVRMPCVLFRRSYGYA